MGNVLLASFLLGCLVVFAWIEMTKFEGMSCASRKSETFVINKSRETQPRSDTLQQWQSVNTLFRRKSLFWRPYRQMFPTAFLLAPRTKLGWCQCEMLRERFETLFNIFENMLGIRSSQAMMICNAVLNILGFRDSDAMIRWIWYFLVRNLKENCHMPRSLPHYKTVR